MKLIICDGYGRKDAYAATIENARKILEESLENLDTEIIDIAEDKESYFIPVPYLMKILSKILEMPEGENIPLLQNFWYGKAPKEGDDVREKALNTSEWKQEVAMMMINENLTKKDLKEGYLSSERYALLENLSFFKEIAIKRNKKVKYVRDDDVLEQASNYSKIIKNVWREGVEEYKVVNFILNFVNENLIDRRNIEYEVIDFQESY